MLPRKLRIPRRILLLLFIFIGCPLGAAAAFLALLSVQSPGQMPDDEFDRRYRAIVGPAGTKGVSADGVLRRLEEAMQPVERWADERRQSMADPAEDDGPAVPFAESLLTGELIGRVAAQAGVAPKVAVFVIEYEKRFEDAGALALLDLLARADDFVPLGGASEADAFPIGAVQYATAMISGQCVRSALRGDLDACLLSIDRLDGLRRAIEYRATFHSKSWAASIGRNRTRAIRACLGAHEWTADELTRLHDAIRDSEALRPRRAAFAQGMALQFESTLYQTHGSVWPNFYMPSAARDAVSDRTLDRRGPDNIRGALLGTRLEKIQRVRESSSIWVKWANSPPSAARGTLDEIEWPSPGHADLWLCTALHPGSVLSIERVEAAEQMLDAVFRVEIHRATHGRLPASLEVLADADGQGVPLDPYQPGASLTYRLANPDARRGGYMLYSIGKDGQDNGGTTDVGSNGDIPLHPFVLDPPTADDARSEP